MCHPNGFVFHQKSLDKGPILVKKKTLRRGLHSTKIAKQNVKSAVFEAEKPLNMGPDLRKLKKTKTKTKKKTSNHFFLKHFEATRKKQ